MNVVHLVSTAQPNLNENIHNGPNPDVLVQYLVIHYFKSMGVIFELELRN